MKKSLFLVLPIFIFLPALLYLHQKVQIYVQAYQLSKNFRYHNELVDKRDYLMHSFAKEVSLAKVNQWAHLQRFTPVDKKRSLALNKVEQKQTVSSKIATLINRFLKASDSSFTVLAKDKK